MTRVPTEPWKAWHLGLWSGNQWFILHQWCIPNVDIYIYSHYWYKNVDTYCNIVIHVMLYLIYLQVYIDNQLIIYWLSSEPLNNHPVDGISSLAIRWCINLFVEITMKMGQYHGQNIVHGCIMVYWESWNNGCMHPDSWINDHYPRLLGFPLFIHKIVITIPKW